MKQYICTICGYIYEEASNGSWEALPDDWKCPVCAAACPSSAISMVPEEYSP